MNQDLNQLFANDQKDLGGKGAGFFLHMAEKSSSIMGSGRAGRR